MKPSDFEMVDGASRIDASKQSCERTPIAQ
jgi:hypothetical protein